MRISKLNVRNVSLGKTLTAYCTLELMVLPSWTCVVVQINKSVANKLGKVAVRFGRHVEAEAVEAANYTASALAIHIERQNLNVVQLFKKYTTKSECLINHHLQRNMFKSLGFT